jgi:hypothetical protein
MKIDEEKGPNKGLVGLDELNAASNHNGQPSTDNNMGCLSPRVDESG